MAQIVINIPDPSVPRVVDALCLSGHWSAELGITRAAFAKNEVARMIRERVVAIERRTALEALIDTPEPDVT
jgi:hypothetical protein